jgi:hypothetical protein
MDEENELEKAKFVLGFGLAFLICGYYAWDAMRYKVFASTADARVLRTYDTSSSSRRGGRTPRLGVEYQFTDKSGASVTEKDEVSLDTVIGSDGQIRVEYLAGIRDSSRIAGSRSAALPILLFLGSLTGLVIFIIKLAHEANAPIKTSRKRR